MTMSLGGQALTLTSTGTNSFSRYRSGKRRPGAMA